MAVVHFCRGLFVLGTVFVILRRAAGAYVQVKVGSGRNLDNNVKLLLDKSLHATALQVKEPRYLHHINSLKVVYHRVPNAVAEWI